jgi:hypothetical protein
VLFCRLKWDESKLQATEKQQKEQVFMKIDEPNTPYIHYNPTTDQVTNWKGIILLLLVYNNTKL